MTDPICKVYIQAPGGNVYPINPLKATLRRDKQDGQLRPRQLELTVPRDAPGNPGQIILVEKLGRIIFRGYVKFYSISKMEKKLTVLGMEDLLLYRITPRFYYDQYTNHTLGQFLASDVTPGIVPGILAIANGYINPGEPYEIHNSSYDYFCVRARGLGTESDIGENKIFYVSDTGIEDLIEYHSLAELEALTTDDSEGFYRDEDDLYVTIGTGQSGWGWWRYGGLIAENYKDTTIRLGTCDDRDHELTSFIMDRSNIGDLIVDVCAASGFFVTFSDDWNYTYINITTSEGRGQVDGIYSFVEEDLLEIEKQERDEPFSHSIIAIGAADWAATHDPHMPNIFPKIERIVEYNDEYGDDDGNLRKYAEDDYSDQARSDKWSITPRRTDLVVMPGDWIKVKPAYESEMLLKVVSVEDDLCTGSVKLDLDEKKTDMGDLWRYMQDSENVFSEHYPMESAPSTSAETIIEYEEIGYLDFTAPAGVLDSNLKPRILMGIEIREYYEDEVSAADLGDAGKINVVLNFTGEDIYYELPGIPPGGARSWSIPQLDITDAVASEETNIEVAVTIYRSGGPEDSMFIVSATYSFQKRAE